MSAAEPTAIMYQNLQASGLLTPVQLAELSGWIAQQKPDLKGMAQEVNRRGWLTVFQIKEVAAGRGAGLKVANRYVLLDILGEGGMGRVYKARDPRMGRDVALKVIRKEKLSNPSSAARFMQEIEVLGRLARHANVVATYDAAQIDGHHYCVMEFIDGTDLTKLIRDKGPMPVPAACDAIRQAALGLHHAFETGLVHRDIKPSNIIVPRAGGSVKLVDLGLARVVGETAEDAHRITQEGYVIGTPDFLAPEQARNPMSVDIRADIYSLGGTLYYILTGRVPYEGSNPTEKLLKHCTDPPPRLLQHRPDAPPQLEQIIHWCMAKNPDERPQTPIHLATALQPFCPPPSGSGSVPVPAQVPASPVPQYPPPGYPPYPQPPVYAQPGAPAPLPDPYPSSQAFELPPEATERSPIRKRAESRFPVGMVLIGLGALFIIAVLSYAAYRVFFTSEPGLPEPFTNTAGMKMVKLDGGTFKMGSPDSEAGRGADEGPVREVTIRGPFFMSATEVTNGQYFKVMGSNPGRSSKIAARSDVLPVESVTWDEANEFCRKLTEKEKGQPWMRKNWEYRLPTEAEWEYACRGGTETPTAFGEQLAFGAQAAFLTAENDPVESRTPPAKAALRFPQEAGKAKANTFGLFDMHGNVAEWCADWYRPDAYKDAPQDNPTGPADGDKRVARGGSWKEPASAARSAARAGYRTGDRLDSVGFRVIYAPVQKEKTSHE